MAKLECLSHAVQQEYVIHYYDKVGITICSRLGYSRSALQRFDQIGHSLKRKCDAKSLFPVRGISGVGGIFCLEWEGVKVSR